MDRDEANKAVHALLLLMQRIATQTRTKADDMFVSILKLNEAKLAEALLALLNDPEQPPTPERASAALATVGIRVAGG